MVLPALIGLAGGLIGEAFKSNAASKANQQAQYANKQARDFAREERQRTQQWNLERRNEQWARDDRYVQRLVSDAGKAGIHPLAALGVSGHGSTAIPQSSPASVPPAQTFGNVGAGDSIGAALSLVSEQVRTQKAETASRKADSALKAAQARYYDSMATEAQSRSIIRDVRAAAQGGAMRTSSTDALDAAILPGMKPRHRTSAGQLMDLYGMIVGELGGLGNFIRDMGAHAKGQDWWPESRILDKPVGRLPSARTSGSSSRRRRRRER